MYKMALCMSSGQSRQFAAGFRGLSGVHCGQYARKGRAYPCGDGLAVVRLALRVARGGGYVCRSWQGRRNG